MSVSDDAKRVQERAINRSDRAASISLRLWREMDADDLDGSWESVGPRVSAATSKVVQSNAVGAGQFVGRVARADGMVGDVLNPGAFAGVDGSGLGLDGLLRGAVVTTKQAIAAGLSLPESLVAGGSYLAVVVKSAIADLERSASLTASTGKGYVRYVRLVNAGACSRCAILAGSDQFKTNFRRHPACRCSTVPVKGDSVPPGFPASPQDYFDSLGAAEQDRVFTRAGAEAIRAGADPTAVVNARRGANRKRMDGTRTYGPSRIQRSVIGRDADGNPILGYVTTEGTTRRGSYGRSRRYAQVTRPRLMPESIIELTDDIDTRRMLLRDAGYLRPNIRRTSDNTWIRELRDQERRDRADADAFYRSKGIGVT